MEFQPHVELVIPLGAGWASHAKIQIGLASGGSEEDRLESFAEDLAADQLTQEQKQTIVDAISKRLGL